MLAAGIGAVWPNGGQRASDPQEVTAYLVAGPIHYDILLPLTPATRAAFEFARHADVPIAHPAAAYLVVGWGSRVFYTATADYSDLSLGTVWTAATGDQSVLRVDVIGSSLPDTARPVQLSQGDEARLLSAILEGVSHQPIENVGLTPTDAFFPAAGRFHLFRTCNVWIAEVFKSAGLAFGRWTPTPFAVTLSHRLFQS